MAEANKRLAATRLKYPAFPQIREVLVRLDQKVDKVKPQILCDFTEFGHIVRQQAEERKVKLAKQAKRDAEIAESKLRWQKQQEREKQLHRELDDDDEEEDEDSDDDEDDNAPRRSQSSSRQKEKKSHKKDHAVEKEVKRDRKIIAPKRNAKANPASGYDPRTSCDEIHNIRKMIQMKKRPSPTKINKALGSDIMKKVAPESTFKIPKKGDRRFLAIGASPAADSPPDCPSLQDDLLDTVVYDPLKDIMDNMESSKKKPVREVRESVVRSPDRPNRIRSHQVDQQVDVVAHEAQDQDADDSVDPNDILGPDEDSAGIRIYPSASLDPDPDPDMEIDQDNGDSGVSEELAEDRGEADAGADTSEPEIQPELVVHRSLSDSLVDHDDLDYGGDDDDEEDDDDDGNFKRGRQSSSAQPAPAVVVPAASRQQNSSNGSMITNASRVPGPRPAAAATAGPSAVRTVPVNNNVIRSLAPTTGTISFSGPRDDDGVEPDSDMIQKKRAERAARFNADNSSQSLFQSFKNKIMNKKPITPTETSVPSPPTITAPAVTASPAAPVVTAPKAAVVRKNKMPTKVALLKDPLPRSFSPDPDDVEPDIVPMPIKPRNRAPVKIVNPAVFLSDATAESDLFAPPEKVLSPPSESEFQPVIQLPVSDVVPDVPDAPSSSNDQADNVTVSTALPVVTPVIRPVPRLDPRLAARSAAARTPAPAPAVTTAPVPESLFPEPLFTPPTASSSRTISPDPFPCEQTSAIDKILFSDDLLIPDRPSESSSSRSDIFGELRAPQSIRNLLTDERNDPVLLPPVPPAQPVSQFNEIVTDKPNIFIHVHAERSAPRFRSYYDDAPPADIPFKLQQDADVPDPRIRILPDGQPDPLVASDEDEDDEGIPIFGEKDDEPETPAVPAVGTIITKVPAPTPATSAASSLPPPPAPVLVTSAERLRRPPAVSDVFKVPIGVPIRKRKLTPEKSVPNGSVKRSRLSVPKMNGKTSVPKPKPVQKPTALIRKPDPNAPKAKANLLTSEICAMKEVMRPARKTMAQRMAEAKKRSEEEEASLIKQSVIISDSRSIKSK